MLRAGHAIVLAAAALLAIGVVMVNSAALSVGDDRTATAGSLLLGRTTILAVLAGLALMAGTRVPVERLRRLAGHPWVPHAVVVGLLALLAAVHLPAVGHEVNGARRWISVGPVGFQPSEFAKWGLVLVLAWYGARRVVVMGQLGRGLLVPMVPVAVICGLIVTEDLGTALLVGTVGVTMLLAAGARLRHAAVLAAPAVAAVAAAVIASPYRIDRLRSFVDPWQDPQGIGYHMIQSMATVGGGGLAGRGLGNSVQKFGYLPEDTTDFIYAVICEELGLAGAAMVVGLFATLLLAGREVVRRVQTPFERLLGLGILVTVGLQALINMMVVTGLAPTKGIALPLVSSGGTGWVLTAFSLGVLAAMDPEAGGRAAGSLHRTGEQEQLEHALAR